MLDFSHVEGPSRPVASRQDRRRWEHLSKLALRQGLVGYRHWRVAEALRAHEGPEGCYPAYQTIADTAECSYRHVPRALRRYEALEMLLRLPPIAGRKSNSYVFLLPPSLPSRTPRQAPPRKRENLILCSGDRESLVQAAKAPIVTAAARRAEIEARLRSGWRPGSG